MLWAEVVERRLGTWKPGLAFDERMGLLPLLRGRGRQEADETEHCDVFHYGVCGEGRDTWIPSSPISWALWIQVQG